MAVTEGVLSPERREADEAVRPFYEACAARLPEGTEWFDAHTHTGLNDPDGYAATPRDIIGSLDRAGHRRALVFSLHEPQGYPEANDRILAEAAASGGRLVPLARVDPGAPDPLGEARRCLKAGARGLKLHPRAEGFALSHPVVDELFALAAEARRPVMIHAGRGMPALGRDTVELARRHPGARPILAHAGISDLGWIWTEAAHLPNLFFDTSWWGAADQLALFSLVPPGRVLYASDAPYGSGRLSGLLMMRTSLQAGLSPELVGQVAGAQLTRVVEGEDPADLGSPPDRRLSARSLHADRALAFLYGAIARAVVDVDPAEFLALARMACDVPDELEEAPLLSAVDELVAASERMLEAGCGDLRAVASPAIAAAAIAATPDVPLRG